ncbi:hypothetical protein GFJ94_11840 [Flavobacterium sp. LMO8]|uniref:hypothetical protein n=1 Tax=Flavobacterium sp. LMO8 TaxID=2654244 RepID=UPI001291A89A|nr:hypothetical protein [Flavobacterium sp. LMO8]MQP25755.1 hypothetical protein [Flavobacterium sp. LMO8]
MKKIIFLLLFVNFCFSQEDKISWQKIDSITNVLSPTFTEIKTIENYLKPEIFKLDSIEIKGKSRFEIEYYFFDDLNISKKIEVYDRENLKKVKYHYYILYEDNSSQEIEVDIYFREKKIFFIIVNDIYKKGKTKLVKNQSFSPSRMKKEPKIELTFCDDVESWLNEKINEISSTLIEKNVNPTKPQ